MSNMNDNNDYGKRKRYIFKVGDWTCPNPECKNINFSRRIKCNRCGAPKPQDDFIGKPKKRYGSGNYYSRSHSGSSDRDKHHHHHHSRKRSYSRSDSNLRNPRQLQNPSFLGGPPGLFKEGDWRCDNCKNINFSWRDKCNKCNRPKKDGNNMIRRPDRGFVGMQRGRNIITGYYQQNLGYFPGRFRANYWRDPHQDGYVKNFRERRDGVRDKEDRNRYRNRNRGKDDKRKKKYRKHSSSRSSSKRNSSSSSSSDRSSKKSSKSSDKSRGSRSNSKSADSPSRSRSSSRSKSGSKGSSRSDSDGSRSPSNSSSNKEDLSPRNIDINSKN